ncbi:MAG TPA: ribosomal protein S18-alanine N-acetyltransferase [Thermomicrobiales bacterium]
MTQDDVPEVSRVERRCFSTPWPASAYRRELRNPTQNAYFVLRAIPNAGADGTVTNSRDGASDHGGQRSADGILGLPRLSLLPRRPTQSPDAPHIAGFAGMWTAFDEAHITTIGVDPIYRGRGFGELLLIGLFDEAIRREANWLTLEVRVSNEVAQRLYRKYGFEVQGTRRRYYSDNGEDAYIMWSRSLRDPGYLAMVNELRAELARRLGPVAEVPPPIEHPLLDPLDFADRGDRAS